MKTLGVSRRTLRHGSTLIVTLLVTLLLGLILASYLQLVSADHASIARSQAWQNALVLAEAGVEEALAQLNPGAGTTNVSGGNGWVLSDGVFQPDPPERTLLGGHYAVIYTPANPPTIYSTGYTTLNLQSKSVQLSRVVQVTTTNAPLYSAGLSFEQIANPSGYSYSKDSYDSVNPNYSDGGQYNPAKARTSATFNPPPNIRTEFPDVLPPFETGLPLPTKVTNTYSLSGNYLIVGDLTLEGNDRLYVDDHRSAVIYVLGNMIMSTESQIEISDSGSLRIYVAGGTAGIDYVNNHGTPENFQYFGLPGNTNLALTQETPEIAASIYAPNASFSADGNANAFNFSGALVVRELVLSRPFNFHFDENLARTGPRRGFQVASWSEL